MSDHGPHVHDVGERAQPASTSLVPPRTAARQPTRSLTLWGLLVVVVSLWTARDVIHFDFVAWDDEYNILVNPHLGPPTPQNLAWMFSDQAYMRRYVPFGWLGFSVAYAFSGLSPFAYHLGNLLLHLANAFLLYVFIAGALRRWHPQPDDAWLPPCAAAAALFWAVHPLRAETVGWASGLLYSQSCFFALLSVLAYARARRPARNALGGTGPDAGHYNVWYWAALLFYAVSILTYPITLGLIAVFIAIDFLQVGRDRRARPEPPDAPPHPWRAQRSRPTFREAFGLFRPQLPFLTATLTVAAVTFSSRVAATSFWPQSPTLGELPVLDRLMRAGYGVAYYLWKTAWPSNLSPLPPQLGPVGPYWPMATLATIAVAGLSLLLWLTRRRRPRALLLWLSFLFLLAPMLGFTDRTYYISDRYSYLPAMVLSLALAAALLSLPRAYRRALAAGAPIVIIALATATATQLQVWQDSTTLFARAVACAQTDHLRADAYQRWANFHAFRGNLPAAEAVLAQAEKDQTHPSALDQIRINLAQARQEHHSGAAPLVTRIHESLSLRLANEGREREAREHFALAQSLAR